MAACLDRLVNMLPTASAGDEAQIDKAVELSNGFRRFIRSLLGLEIPAVAEAVDCC